MDRLITFDALSSPLPAGKLVPAGRYRQIDVPWGRLILLDPEGHLPASLDGHVALYEPVALYYSVRAVSAN